MNTRTLSLHCNDLRDQLLPLLVDRVFHVTRLSSLDQILASGEIRSNRDSQLPTLYGSTNSFFKNRGCVSVFDYRTATREEIDESIMKCPPWPISERELAFLFLSSAVYSRLIERTEWEKARTEKLVPRVEAGYPEAIPMASIDEIFRVVIERPVNPFEEAVNRRRKHLTEGHL